ncbi:hypothetical protein BGZ99_005291 [Dissophora globulifera]|uniref:Uncharacterized protein n=1 Tax=Dissophora globulifera TaxID=979702 RepID=A0A9P6RHX8_9FUNG|nr:hypothetical protein BGZ99_005291 [Dissophora globulifera]
MLSGPPPSEARTFRYALMKIALETNAAKVVIMDSVIILNSLPAVIMFSACLPFGATVVIVVVAIFVNTAATRRKLGQTYVEVSVACYHTDRGIE